MSIADWLFPCTVHLIGRCISGDFQRLLNLYRLVFTLESIPRWDNRLWCDFHINRMIPCPLFFSGKHAIVAQNGIRRLPYAQMKYLMSIYWNTWCLSIVIMWLSRIPHKLILFRTPIESYGRIWRITNPACICRRNRNGNRVGWDLAWFPRRLPWGSPPSDTEWEISIQNYIK